MRLILVGFGTVGRGLADSLVEAGPALRGLGLEPRVVAVVDPVVGSVAHAEGFDLERLVSLADAGEPLSEHPGAEGLSGVDDAITRAPADVLVELTPTDLQTGQPGLDHVRAAIAAGLHVVTSNKGPIALAYRELAEAAKARGVELRFEGTVMSGTPVLNVCETGLAGAGIQGIRGVVNGTCNFILTQMERGIDFDQALAEAQRLGYAEADPSGDVDAWDAAAKALILANCVLGADLRIDQVKRHGIREISLVDVEAAAVEGKSWRLVARVERDGDGWRARVAPEAVDRQDPIGALTGPGNLLVFDTLALGEVAIAGPGAGRRATGQAVIADLVGIQQRSHT